MKTRYNYIKLLPLVLVLGIISCQDMDEVHEEYVADGEIIYTNKVDSLRTFAGKNRVKISGYITGGFNVNEVVVTWNKGLDQQIFPYQKSSEDTDLINLIVTDLNEDNYEFTVYSKDEDGNKSIPVVVFGSAYGENYQSNLEPRAVNNVSFDGTNLEVILALSNELQRETEFKFTDINNTEIIKSALEDDLLVTLNNISLNKPITYRTYYVPTQAVEGEETSIDKFESNWQVLTLPTIGGIMDSVSFTSVLGGVKANWSNPNGANLVLTFEYTAGGNLKTQTFESSDTNGEAIISGMDPGEQNMAVTIADVYGNSFGPNTFIVSPQEASQLDKTGWSIIDFSSEEAGGEGPVNGYVTAAIDGDINTFWHTTWSTGSPDYPHYFTVDMGAEKTIASFEVFRRQNNGSGQTKHQFFVSNDGVTWTDMGTFNMDSSSNDGQVYPMADNPTARYFKYVATEGPNNFAFLGEINVYGLE